MRNTVSWLRAHHESVFGGPDEPDLLQGSNPFLVPLEQLVSDALQGRDSDPPADHEEGLVPVGIHLKAPIRSLHVDLDGACRPAPGPAHLTCGGYVTRFISRVVDVLPLASHVWRMYLRVHLTCGGQATTLISHVEGVSPLGSHVWGTYLRVHLTCGAVK